MAVFRPTHVKRSIQKRHVRSNYWSTPTEVRLWQ
jgi:hypothetical protein